MSDTTKKRMSLYMYFGVLQYNYCASHDSDESNLSSKLNLTESDKVAIKYEEGSGTGRRNILQNGTVSINGLPTCYGFYA